MGSGKDISYPLLIFDVYTDRTFQEALYEAEMGVKINGQYINNVRYDDDTVLIASSSTELKEIINKVNRTKTKSMSISRENHINVTTNNQRTEQISEFKYLGCYVTQIIEPKVEVKRRCGYARAPFKKMKKMLID